MGYGYQNLARDFGWSEGVHKAPVNYEHPWLVVTEDGTIGAWSRDAARKALREYRRTGELEAARQYS